MFELNILFEKLKEILNSVLPITLIVLLLNFTVAPLGNPLLAKFLIGSLLVTLGISIFSFGIDVGIKPVGNLMGSKIAKSNRWSVILVAGVILGFTFSVAEPDLHVLGSQVDLVTKGLISRENIVVVVSIGIALLFTLGLFRIVHNIPLYKMMIVIYGIIFVLSLFTSREFLAIAFDASGATTGVVAIPFVLALADGISAMKKDSKASEKDSFGLAGITSTGAILAIMIMGILFGVNNNIADLGVGQVLPEPMNLSLIHQTSTIAYEVFLALLPIMTVFFMLQFVSFKLPLKAIKKILFGLFFTYIGLVIFFIGVNAGFMGVGTFIGNQVALLENKIPLILVGLVLGFVSVLAEPAVYVLAHQIENVTSGFVKKKFVLVTLAIGVGVAVALSMLRILVPAIQLWHYLLPLYSISLAMSFFVPKLFVGIAFDSGGVAAGTMTATFILAFSQGAANAIESASVMIDGFGIIAMVASTPLIALQVLGLILNIKSRKRGVTEVHE